jgi:hypothetical protein
MDILEKLPALPEDGLKTLLANAQRLESIGSPAQRASASALLPAIEAELQARKAARQAAKAPAVRPPSRGRRKPRAEAPPTLAN